MIAVWLVVAGSTPAGEFMISIVTTADSDIVEPTAKSIAPPMTTSAMPTEAMPIVDTARSMFRKFSPLKNNGLTIAATMMITMIPNISPHSRRMLANETLLFTFSNFLAPLN
jgi:hypothetical protein